MHGIKIYYVDVDKYFWWLCLTWMCMGWNLMYIFRFTMPSQIIEGKQLLWKNVRLVVVFFCVSAYEKLRQRKECVVSTVYRVSVSRGALWLAVTVRTPLHSAPCVVGTFSSGDQEAGPLPLTGAEDLLWRYGLVYMGAIFIGQSCVCCLTIQFGVLIN